MLKPGDHAPAFSLTATDGSIVNLSDFQGKKIVLYFYPRDNTPGCTMEACSLRDHYAEISTKAVILGISHDNQAAHKKFTEKYSLPFPLLCDVDHKIAEAFGVWGEKSFMGRKHMGILRTTFIIDSSGKITHVIEKVDTKQHAEQVLPLL